MISDKAKEYIENNKVLLQEDRFQEFFDKINEFDRRGLAEFFLLDCNINFLECMNYVPRNLFNKSKRLKTITIPESIIKIEQGAFWHCESLQSIDIPKSVIKIGDFAFGYCTSLQSINISDSITRIGEGTFDGCNSLKSINIPESVANIGECAFKGCESLQSIKLPIKFKDDLRWIDIDESKTKVIWY